MVIQQLMGDLVTIKHKHLIKLGKVLRSNETVVFTATESRILSILMNNFGKQISTSDLSVEVFGWDVGGHSNALRVHIHRIRKGLSKIDENYVLSYKDGSVCLEYLEVLDKIKDLKTSLRTLLSNESHLEDKDYELLKLLKEA
jgi:two-component SAPR family response regulator